MLPEDLLSILLITCSVLQDRFHTYYLCYQNGLKFFIFRFAISDIKFSKLEKRTPKIRSIENLENISLSPITPFSFLYKVRKTAKIRNQYYQVPHLTQDTNG